MAVVALGTALRLVVGITLFYAAVGKIRTRALTDETFGALGVPFPRFGAIVVVVLEACAATSLLAALFAVAGAVLAAILLTAFIATGWYTHRARRLIPCSCFGHSQSMLGAGTAVRAALLLILCGSYLGIALAVSHVAWPPSADLVFAFGIAAMALVLGRWILALPLFRELVRLRVPQPSSGRGAI